MVQCSKRPRPPPSNVCRCSNPGGIRCRDYGGHRHRFSPHARFFGRHWRSNNVRVCNLRSYAYPSLDSRHLCGRCALAAGLPVRCKRTAYVMPWTARDAKSHTRKASSPKKARQWSHVANNMLSRGKSEGAAIRAANAVVGRKGRSMKRKRKSSRRSRRY
jgi:hypothetical protein